MQSCPHASFNEGIISMDERGKGAQDWYKKGTEAMNHKNWDYAIKAFGMCVVLMPEVLLYRQSKHGCVRKSYDDNGSGARMAGMRLMGIRGRIKKCRMQKDWKGVETAAEEGLLVNPWDAQLMFDLGDACENQQNMNVARYGLERAVEYDKDNIEYNRRLGKLLIERRDYKPARACFERIYKLDPNDGDARTMMSRVDAEATMDRGGYDNADTTRDVKTEQPAAPVNAYEEDRRARKGTPKSADAPGESEEADLLHGIRKDPKNLNLYLKLADVYIKDRQFGKAVDQYNKALEVSNGNADIREQLNEVQLLMLRNDLSEAEDRARKNPGKERLVEKVKTMRSELLDKEMEFFTHSVELHPNDMRKKYELAQRYVTTKQPAKAIPLLQQAVSDPRIKVEALVLLGECFAKDGKLDLGRRQFEKALDGLSATDKPDPFKTAHYYLGRIYEKGGKKDQAEHHYGEILAVDYEYKDVLKRLEGLQGGEDKGIVEDAEDAE
ncbi:MAG TPA: tetratricopeptide repeat protein [Planctomycetaceae bacterium]|nr:tetratricopeptide repeat protein [Planctomycetaceae bacterium]HQZ64978.1 tetratricopeptide repeat protein [Planctomycetaceae bacterium]